MAPIHKPFRFDRAFGSAASSDAAAVVEPTFTAFDVDRAHDAGFAEGRRLALAEEGVVSERARAEALTAIAEQLSALRAGLAADRERVAEDAAMLALAICQGLLAKPAAEHFGDEVVARVREVIERLPTPSRLVVHVGPATHADLTEPLAALASPELAVRLVADPTLAPGQARLAWGEGELLVDIEERWRAIHELIARTLGRQLPKADALLAERTGPADHDLPPDERGEA